ncbi:MAG: hypothetical protein ACFCUS_02325 [Rubrimonas sp.]|uniref:hypothetical protein n=1 Tax=Rubrimonas sp. TaxID=2036015 RepID=UPI002FDDDE10
MTHEQTKRLEYLLAEARKVKVTDDDVAEQRRSFAYGNASFENERITREMVDAEDRKRARANG